MRHYVEQVVQLNLQALKLSSDVYEIVLQIQVRRQFPGVMQLRWIRKRQKFALQIGFTALHSRQNDILDFGVSSTWFATGARLWNCAALCADSRTD